MCRYSFVKNVFFLLGIVVLLPWNFLATASDYWMYKFRNVTSGSDPLSRTSLQTHFFGAFAVSSTVPSLLAVLLATLVNDRIRQEVRNVLSLCLCLVLMAAVMAFVQVDTDSWQDGFFVLSMVLIVLVNGFSSWLTMGITGLAGAATFGLHAQLRHRHDGRETKGGHTGSRRAQAVAGVFASGLQVVTLLGHTDPCVAALAYFGCALVVLLVSLLCFMAMQSSEFFQYCLKNPQRSMQAMISYEDLEISVSPLVVFRKMWVQGASSALVFGVSMMVFPAVTVLVVSQNVLSGSAWTGRFFIPVCNYLLFNLGDLTGRVACAWLPLDEKRGKLVLSLSAGRLAFVPLLMLCNAQPRHYLPVVFDSDVAFVVLIAGLAVSNGYLYSAAMQQLPKRVEGYLQEKAGFLMTLCTMVGLCVGSFFSVILVKLL
ncbi:hypothetical protein HPB47_002337 [Ixodes persulcatus]|uniref:Uncharacterized protein n=1 Tax=Ixodes persulcatus TaxID=34615 RepID=A0AC60PLX7_IXOPE|nr:hypothetical protein HPB47_002337 [Ixodes persulcatus]